MFFNWTFFAAKLSSRWSNQVSKIILTACQFAWYPALDETPAAALCLNSPQGDLSWIKGRRPFFTATFKLSLLNFKEFATPRSSFNYLSNTLSRTKSSNWPRLPIKKTHYPWEMHTNFREPYCLTVSDELFILQHICCIYVHVNQKCYRNTSSFSWCWFGTSNTALCWGNRPKLIKDGIDQMWCMTNTATMHAGICCS